MSAPIIFHFWLQYFTASVFVNKYYVIISISMKNIQLEILSCLLKNNINYFS